MWIASVFPGDEDTAAMHVQHATYGTCVSLLVGAAHQRYRKAAQTLKVSTPESFLILKMQGFDHRALQDAHDLIAAYWRFRSGLRSPRLPDMGPSPEQLKTDWLKWFGNELEDLCEYPQFTNATVKAAAYGNLELGYAAEKELTVFLRERYMEMWKPASVSE